MKQTIKNVLKWRVVLGFPRYEVCTIGLVRKTKSKVLCKLHSDRDGYIYCYLSNPHEKSKAMYVHRLMMMAFKPKAGAIGIADYRWLQVNHRTEIRHWNMIGALEWCTAAYNKWYSSELGCLARSKTLVTFTRWQAGELDEYKKTTHHTQKAA